MRLLSLRAALVSLVAVNAVAFALLLRLDFNNAPEVYFPETAPSVVLQKDLQREFPNDEALVAVFEGDDLFAAHTLAAVDRATRRIAGHALVDRVFSVTNVDHIAAGGEGFAIEPLVDANRLGDSTDQQRRDRVLADRFAPGLLVARDGSALALVVRPKPLDESRQRKALEDLTYQVVAEEGLGDKLRGVAGPVALDVAELRSMLRDSAIFIPATSVIGLGLLWWVVGRIVPVVLGAVAMSTVVAASVALLPLAAQPYTLVNAMTPPLLGAYTLATLIHFYGALMQAGDLGLAGESRVLRALADVRKPAFFNVLTTGSGLLSLAFNPIPPLRSFGVVGAIGTLIVFLVVFYLVPPLLVRWDVRPWPRHGAGMRWTRKLAVAIARVSMRRAGLTVILAAAAILVSIPAIWRVEVESDLLEFFGPEHPLTKATTLVEEKFTGVTTLQVVLDGGGRDALKDVAVLRRLKDLQSWLEGLPQVDRALSMVDVVEEMHWAFHDEDPAFRTVPGDNRLLSQYLLVYDGQDLYELVNREFQRTRVLLNLNVHGAVAIQGVIAAIRDRLHAEPIPGLKWDISGYGRLFADQQDLLVIGQQRSFLGAFGQIFFLMAILWRSLTAATITMLPNLAPLYFIFVVMGLWGIPLDMATVLIAGVVLGITVDDTIHLYHNYLRRRRAGAGTVLALMRSFDTSGRAVIAASLLLIAQFLLLMTSEFKPTVAFGGLTAAGLLIGQVFEMILLPALIVLKDRGGLRRLR